MAEKPTKERILDAAEELLADHGFVGTSMRAITSAAEVNLASVNYHFGSKEALIQAVFERRLAPLNRERLERLDALEEEAGAAPALERIVEAFVRPALRLSQSHEHEWGVFRRLLGHAMSLPDGKSREMFTEQFREILRRFTAAFRRALPEVPEQEILWRFLFMVGAMAHTMAMADDMARMTDGLCDGRDVEATVRRLVPFIATGFRTPVGEGHDA